MSRMSEVSLPLRFVVLPAVGGVALWCIAGLHRFWSWTSEAESSGLTLQLLDLMDSSSGARAYVEVLFSHIVVLQGIDVMVARSLAAKDCEDKDYPGRRIAAVAHYQLNAYFHGEVER